MKYVEIDEQTSELSWDRYFEYLRSARAQFPPDLYSYAIDWDHYSLDGANSLHDAWLTGAQFAYRGQDVTLEFLSARQDRKHTLRYLGVQAYSIDVSVEYRFGDRDVLAHEFCAADGLVTHEIVFPNRKSILLRAKNVSPLTEMLS